MRNDLPTISESAEDIRQRIESTTRKRMKQRLEALYLIQSGECKTRESVAESLGVHRHTISRWLAKYEAGGVDELLEIRTRPNRKRVVPADVYKKLENQLRTSPEQFSSYRDVQAWLKEQFGLDVKYKTLYRLVRYELKISVGASSAKAKKKAEISTSELAHSTSIDEGSAEETAKVITEKPSNDKSDPDLFKPKAPTVANFFRSVAMLLEDDQVESKNVVQAVRAANAILNASPPFGFYAAKGQTYVPVKGRLMERRKRDAQRELRKLQSFVTNDSESAERTRALLNRLADRFDSVGYNYSETPVIGDQDTTSAIEIGDTRSAVAGTSVEPTEKASAIDLEEMFVQEEPDDVFLDDDLEMSDIAFEDQLVSGSGAGSIASLDLTADYIVLFAEEDDVTASIVRRQLGKQSASVVRATSSKQVLELLATVQVDLLILNTQIQDEDGLELLRKLRDEPAFDNMPIVAVGWPDDNADESEVMRYGADAYIEKPFAPNVFSATIMGLLIASRASVQRRDDRGPITVSKHKAARDGRKEDSERT